MSASEPQARQLFRVVNMSVGYQLPPLCTSAFSAYVSDALSRKVLIFLPTYNEARNLGNLVRDLRRLQPAASLLICDDNSPDGTGEVADELQRTVSDVKVIHRPGKQGLGTAHVLGMDRAIAGGYEVLLTMDCDYTHRPEDVSLLIDALAARRVSAPVGEKVWAAAAPALQDSASRACRR